MLEEMKGDTGGIVLFLSRMRKVVAFVNQTFELSIISEIADNYVQIWYLNKGVVTKVMLRNTLKAMEEQFEGTKCTIECHRSYMVNLEHVKVIRREKDGII